MTNEDILREEFESIKEDLIEKHKELGMKASGLWEESLQVTVNGLTGILTGQHYTEQLVNGRESGRFPPVAAIEKWITDKGLRIVDQQISISSLAFLIARKIAREGTEYFKQGGTELISSVITPERIDRIILRVSQFNVSSFVSDVTKVFQELEAA